MVFSVQTLFNRIKILFMKIMTIRSIMVLPLSFLATTAIIFYHLPQILLCLVIMAVPSIFGILDRKKFLSNDPLVRVSSFNFYSASIFWPMGIGISLFLNGVDLETYYNVTLCWSLAISLFAPIAIHAIVGQCFIVSEERKIA